MPFVRGRRSAIHAIRVNLWLNHHAGCALGLHAFRDGTRFGSSETPNMVFTQSRGFVVGELLGLPRRSLR